MIPQHFFLRPADHANGDHSIQHGTTTVGTCVCLAKLESPSEWHPLRRARARPPTTRRSTTPWVTASTTTTTTTRPHHLPPALEDEPPPTHEHNHVSMITCQFEGTDPLSDLLRAEAAAAAAASHNHYNTRRSHADTQITPTTLSYTRQHNKPRNNSEPTNITNGGRPPRTNDDPTMILPAWRGWDQESASVMRAFGFEGGTNQDHNHHNHHQQHHRTNNNNIKKSLRSSLSSGSLLDARMEDLAVQLMEMQNTNNGKRMTGRPEELVRVLERSLRYLTFYANGVADQSIFARVEWMTTYPALMCRICRHLLEPHLLQPLLTILTSSQKNQTPNPNHDTHPSLYHIHCHPSLSCVSSTSHDSRDANHYIRQDDVYHDHMERETVIQPMSGSSQAVPAYGMISCDHTPLPWNHHDENNSDSSSSSSSNSSWEEDPVDVCRDWQRRLVAIPELVPRIYVEISLLSLHSHLNNSNDDDDLATALSRIARSIRGIGDPLVALYARGYLAQWCLEWITTNYNTPTMKNDNERQTKDTVEHVSRSMLAVIHETALWLVLDHFKSHESAVWSARVQLELKRIDISMNDYLRIQTPALSWIIQSASATTTAITTQQTTHHTAFDPFTTSVSKNPTPWWWLSWFQTHCGSIEILALLLQHGTTLQSTKHVDNDNDDDDDVMGILDLISNTHLYGTPPTHRPNKPNIITTATTTRTESFHDTLFGEHSIFANHQTSRHPEEEEMGADEGFFVGQSGDVFERDETETTMMSSSHPLPLRPLEVVGEDGLEQIIMEEVSTELVDKRVSVCTILAKVLLSSPPPILHLPFIVAGVQTFMRPCHNRIIYLECTHAWLHLLEQYTDHNRTTHDLVPKLLQALVDANNSSPWKEPLDLESAQHLQHIWMVSWTMAPRIIKDETHRNNILHLYRLLLHWNPIHVMEHICSVIIDSATVIHTGHVIVSPIMIEMLSLLLHSQCKEDAAFLNKATDLICNRFLGRVVLPCLLGTVQTKEDWNQRFLLCQDLIQTFSSLEVATYSLVWIVGSTLAVQGHALDPSCLDECMDYCRTIIPSIGNVAWRLTLYRACATTVLHTSRSFTMAHGLLKAAISNLAHVSLAQQQQQQQPTATDYNPVEDDIVKAVIPLLGLVLVFPSGDSPGQPGPLYLVRGIWHACSRVDWNPNGTACVPVYIHILGVLSAIYQRGDNHNDAELHQLASRTIHTICLEYLPRLKTSQRKANVLADLLDQMTTCLQMEHEETRTFVQRLFAILVSMSHNNPMIAARLATTRTLLDHALSSNVVNQTLLAIPTLQTNDTLIL